MQNLRSYTVDLRMNARPLLLNSTVNVSVCWGFPIRVCFGCGIISPCSLLYLLRITAPRILWECSMLHHLMWPYQAVNQGLLEDSQRLFCLSLILELSAPLMHLLQTRVFVYSGPNFRCFIAGCYAVWKRKCFSTGLLIWNREQKANPVGYPPLQQPAAVVQSVTVHHVKIKKDSCESRD